MLGSGSLHKKAVSYWREYWSGRTSAGHRHCTPVWEEFYARELLLYFPAGQSKTLELGCGNGCLYRFIRHRCVSYVGVDFSKAMLERFKSEWPDVELVCADVARLPPLGPNFNLVFSNEVCQFLTESMLRSNLEQVSQLLVDGGIYLIANIPDAHLRLFYYGTGLRGDRNAKLSRLIRKSIDVWVRRKDDGIGKWYSRRGVSRVAAEYNFDCETFSSASHEYRFHALLTKQSRVCRRRVP